MRWNNTEDREGPAFSIPEDGVEEIIYETPGTVIKFGDVSWFDKPAKIELRKWYVNKSETEESEELKPTGKGITMPKDAWHKLTQVLVDQAYANTSELIESLKSRDDINQAIRNNFTDEELDEIKAMKVTEVTYEAEDILEAITKDK